MSARSSIPYLDKTVCLNPHLVILGAGTSVAACPNGDVYGNRLPVMTNLIETTGLSSLLGDEASTVTNFESFYSDLVTSGKNEDLISELEEPCAITSQVCRFRINLLSTIIFSFVYEKRTSSLPSTGTPYWPRPTSGI